jgi:glycosyltransferase involved in cell wall biosynthesis
MSEDLPLVSIVTPVYNGARYIEDLILSVKNQDYPKIEHIVVDDGSTDDGATIRILKKYPHLRWWTRPNQGQYATMNEGLATAKGELVCFVSADDIVSLGAVKKAVDFLRLHPLYHGVFGRTGHIDESGKKMPTYILFQGMPSAWVEVFAHIPHCSLYIKRESLERFDLDFDPKFRYVGDYEWGIRIARQRLKIAHVTDEFSAVRYHANQATRLYADQMQTELEYVYKTYRVNMFCRKSAQLLYYYYFRWWQIGRVYANDGVKGVARHVRKFLTKVLGGKRS